MTHRDYNNNSTSLHKRLSVQVSLTGLSFLVTDRDSKTSLFFSEKNFDRSYTPEELLHEIDTELTRPELQSDTFEEVVVIYATNTYTLVPSTLYDESKSSEYLKFNTKLLANDFITTDSITTYGIEVVYVPFVNINNYFFDRFGSFSYYHSASILLKTFLDAEKHSQSTKVYLHVQQDQLDCVVMKSDALQLCNTYPFKTPEDFIYYVLFTLEQLKLNPDTVDVVLCGAVSEKDDIYSIVYKYIRNVRFASITTAIDTVSEEDQPHNHFLVKNTP